MICKYMIYALPKWSQMHIEKLMLLCWIDKTWQYCCQNSEFPIKVQTRKQDTNNYTGKQLQQIIVKSAKILYTVIVLRKLSYENWANNTNWKINIVCFQPMSS